MSEIRVRIPPSPTGLLHVGTVRTALYNYLFAKKHKGKIVFRFEDTDKERSKKEYEEDILSGLKNLGLSYDEGVFYQSKRTEIYKKYLEVLLEEGKAYKCFCTKEELEKKREEQIKNKLPPRHECCCCDNQDRKGDFVVRFKVSKNKDIIFDDLVRGKVKISSNEIADFVIAKSMTEPLYNYCVVVDDYEMKISHIIRGEDGISNTPKQIMIYEAFNWNIPQFAHLPLILNQDKSKLSKRKNRVSVDAFLEDGILPDALLNFLALLGWNTSDEKEIFTLDELIQEFDLKNVHKGGAVFDEKKLLWINGLYIRNKSTEELKKLVIPYLKKANIDYMKHGEDFFTKALKSTQERMKKLSEAPELLAFFFKEDLDYPVDFFEHEKMGVTQDVAKKALKEAINAISNLEEITQETTEEVLVAKIKELGWKNGQLLWPIRVALSGEKFSPGVFELLEIFGRNESLKRINKGLEILA